MFYRKTGTGTGVGPENQQAMRALVDRGTVPGLIGYEDGVPVAWVSLDCPWSPDDAPTAESTGWNHLA
jgi:hypothetical protein